MNKGAEGTCGCDLGAIGNGWDLSFHCIRHASREMWAGTRQLPQNIERLARETGNRQRSDGGRRSWDRDDPRALSMCSGYEQYTGIYDQGRTRISHNGDPGSLP